MIFKGYQWMLTALISMSFAFMTAGIAHAQSCNDATIQGSCVLQAVASPTTAGVAAAGGPEALVGLITFDRAGNFKMRPHKNANGTFVQADIIGTYTVQSNRDGSY